MHIFGYIGLRIWDVRYLYSLSHTWKLDDKERGARNAYPQYQYIILRVCLSAPSPPPIVLSLYLSLFQNSTNGELKPVIVEMIERGGFEAIWDFTWDYWQISECGKNCVPPRFRWCMSVSRYLFKASTDFRTTCHARLYFYPTKHIWLWDWSP